MSVSLINGHIDDDVQGMTDNDIIKALECCRNGLCTDCPRLNTPAHILLCKEQLMCEALDLINRQKAEIESRNGIILKQKELIERTQKLVDGTDKNCRTAINIIGRYERQFESIKAEAVKGFAERLKGKLHLNGVAMGSNCAIVEDTDIDNLVKEMVGEG